MKHFTNYIHNKSSNTIIKKKFVSNFLDDPKHLIIYGPFNSGKYTLALLICELFSKSKLKYSRNININLQKEDIFFHMSDIHFEIDFELLGPKQYNIWLEFFSLVKEIIQTQYKKAIIVCINFHHLKYELLNIFFTFMRDEYIKFILCTKNVTYIPSNLKQKCNIIHTKQRKLDIIKNEYENYKNAHCDKIINYMKYKYIPFFEFRIDLYNILIYNIDIHIFFSYFIHNLIEKEYLNEEKCIQVFDFLIKDMILLNNNYRTIYHIEKICLMIREIIQKEDNVIIYEPGKGT